VDKKTKKFLVIYPYRFNDFLWNLLELDEISEFAEVVVWDVSLISSARFSRGLKGKRTPRSEIIILNSFLDLNRQLKKFLSERNPQDVCILNEVGQTSFQNFLVNLILAFKLYKKDVKIFDLYNGGVPLLNTSGATDVKKKSHFSKLISTIRKSSNTAEFLQKLVAFFSSKLHNFLPKILTHRFVAGEVWHKEASKSIGLGVQIVKGHSHDYSQYLKLVMSAEKQTTIQSATLLDGAGPFSQSDSLLTRRGVFFSSEVWYPALSNFFDFLEGTQRIKIRIAGHYKTCYDSPSELFGGREVIYGQTLELVESSQFVLTRMSTAVSFAILYKKPILFLYSDQLLKDSEFMGNVFGFSALLGTSPINIDHFPKNIDHYLAVNDEMYEKYIHDVLTSKPLGAPNYKIILEDIMGIKVDR
jgi:hypothetical protein